MIAVEQALSLIRNHVKTGQLITLPIEDAMGCVLAKDVVSGMDLPPFRQSAMDGFAVRTWDKKTYRILGEIQAGVSKEISLKPGEAVRIFTGAAVPEDADRVIMKEHVEASSSSFQWIKISDKTNIKLPGEQVKRGDVVLSKGSVLNTASLSFLAGLGIESLEVYKKPGVAVLISGNELLRPGDPWERAKIFDSNSYIFNFLLKVSGIEAIKIVYVKDDAKACISRVSELLSQYDFVLASGGISVGDYDLMRDAFSENKVQEVFYKINQKPGKPIFFGKKNNTIVFGLPGNPAACFINFQLYVLPALKRSMGVSNFNFKKGICNQRILSDSDKGLFLRGRCFNGHLEPFENQSSSLLKSLIDANALIYIPETTHVVEIGQEVQYLDIVQ